MKKKILSFLLAFQILIPNGYTSEMKSMEYYARIQDQLRGKVYSVNGALVLLTDEGNILWSGTDTFGKMSSVDDSEAIEQIVVSSGAFSLCLLEGGEIRYYGKQENLDFFEGKLENVKMLAATRGSAHALFYDGTVRCLFNQKLALIEEYNEVDEWKDIIAISAGRSFLVGLRKDGTVLCSRTMGTDDWCRVTEWTDIIQVAAGYTGVIGLKRDGTVIANGIYADDGKSGTPPPMPAFDFSDWTDIVQVVAGVNYVAGLSKDGTVCVEGGEDNENVQGIKYATGKWKDIVYIQGRTDFLVGIQNDGTVRATGGLRKNNIDIEGWKAFTAE